MCGSRIFSCGLFPKRPWTRRCRFPACGKCRSFRFEWVLRGDSMRFAKPPRLLLSLALEGGNAARKSVRRCKAKLKSNRGGFAKRIESPRRTHSNRKLRHFPHAGNRHRRVHGRLGKRPHEKIRLPQIYYSRRRTRRSFENCRSALAKRRFREHARSRFAPLPPPTG